MGIAPGANINYLTGHGIFEATHGTASKFASPDKVNPPSVILSGIMMFKHMGWNGSADLAMKGIEGAIADRIVTYGFARLMRADGIEKVREARCSEYGRAIIERM